MGGQLQAVARPTGGVPFPWAMAATAPQRSLSRNLRPLQPATSPQGLLGAAHPAQPLPAPLPAPRLHPHWPPRMAFPKHTLDLAVPAAETCNAPSPARLLAMAATSPLRLCPRLCPLSPHTWAQWHLWSWARCSPCEPHGTRACTAGNRSPNHVLCAAHSRERKATPRPPPPRSPQGPRPPATRPVFPLWTPATQPRAFGGPKGQCSDPHLPAWG